MINSGYDCDLIKYDIEDLLSKLIVLFDEIGWEDGRVGAPE